MLVHCRLSIVIVDSSDSKDGAADSSRPWGHTVSHARQIGGRVGQRLFHSDLSSAVCLQREEWHGDERC